MGLLFEQIDLTLVLSGRAWGRITPKSEKRSESVIDMLAIAKAPDRDGYT